MTSLVDILDCADIDAEVEDIDKALTAISKVDLSRLPPCCDSLFTHIQRGNHRLACYKRAALPVFEHPKPFED